MNQPIELRSISDMTQYEMNSRYNYFERSKRQKLYLYVVKKSNVECYKKSDSGPDVECHVAANTIHIGAPATHGIQISNVLMTEPIWRMRKLDNGDFIKLTYRVVHELKPGATRFENIENSQTVVRGKMVEEVSVFDIGDIGYELRDMTPEQAAEKYFGVSDFRQFFSNYAAASKQMSLKNHPHVRRDYDRDDDLRSQVGLPRIAPKGIQLTGMHPVKPSSFHEYVEAGKQLFSGKHPVGPSSRFLVPASILTGLTSVALARSGRPLSGLALASVPLIGDIHSRIREQQQFNQLQRTKTVALSNEDREKLLAKGALASELTRRLTTPNSQSAMNRLHFRDTYNRVHQKPTSVRIHLSQERRGGRKMRRTKKK
jgi:hypothetical protein